MRRRIKSIGTSEAKTRLSELLRRVAQGEKITITGHGVAAALLVPVPEMTPRFSDKKIVEEMRALRKRVKPGKMSIREMIGEGRRF
jgi:prevent-host-death family protein